MNFVRKAMMILITLLVLLGVAMLLAKAMKNGGKLDLESLSREAWRYVEEIGEKVMWAFHKYIEPMTDRMADTINEKLNEFANQR